MANWQRTTFRVLEESREKLKNLSDRSGLKQKEILDEIIRRSSKEGWIWDDCEPGKKLSPVYEKYADLTISERVTFELTDKAMAGLERVSGLHPDLSRDQILNIMIFEQEFHLGFPLRKQRESLQKLSKELKELKKVMARIDKKISINFKEGEMARQVIGWDNFNKEYERFQGAIKSWSKTKISRETHDIPGRNV